jgi:hypothetical protein
MADADPRWPRGRHGVVQLAAHLVYDAHMGRCAVLLGLVAACNNLPKAADPVPEEQTEQEEKATFAQEHPFGSGAQAQSQSAGAGAFLPSDCPRDDSQAGPRNGAVAGGDAYRVEACRDQSKRLQDQLDAFCADGQQDACKLRDFTVKKRGCCTWHYGVRGCSGEAHRVTCFDNTVASGPACGC